MSRRRSQAGAVGTYLLLAQIWPYLASAQNTPADFCSSLNTAEGSAKLSIYQTQGLCRDQCIGGKYAFAILNYQSCWCSNIAPSKSTKVDDDECNTKCPAYHEWCGGKNQRYGYLELGKTPEGTQGPKDDDDDDGDNTTTGTTTSAQSSESPSSTDSTSSTVKTISGTDGIQTVTITPTHDPKEEEGGGGGLSGGAIAGIVVGVLGVVIAAIAAGFFIIRRRRAGEEGHGPSGSRNSNSTAFTDMKDSNGLATPAGAMLGGSQAGNRDSRLMPADPRMDPFSGGLYVRTKSRESINTLHDEQDYSRRVHQPRVLRAMNPDPDVG